MPDTSNIKHTIKHGKALMYAKFAYNTPTYIKLLPFELQNIMIEEVEMRFLFVFSKMLVNDFFEIFRIYSC